MRRFWIGALVSGSITLGAVGAPAMAQSEWQFEVTPYAWLSGVDGDIGSLPISGISPQHVSLSFGDIWDDLDFAGMLFASARHDPWVVYVDATYVKTTSKESLPPVVDTLEVTSKTTTFALAVGRSVSRDDRHNIDAYVGARAWWLENEFNATIAAGFGGGQRSAGTDANWVDPLIGVAGSYVASDRWTLFGNAEVGGFGVGADNEWSVMAGATYNFNERFGVSMAYRVLAVDYSDDDIVYDVTQSGPVLGATFKF